MRLPLANTWERKIKRLVSSCEFGIGKKKKKDFLLFVFVFKEKVFILIHKIELIQIGRAILGFE